MSVLVELGRFGCYFSCSGCAQQLMLLNAVMALALKNGSNRESVARSMKVMEHEWVVDICPAEGLAD